MEMETREVHVFDANGDGHNDIVFINLTSNNQDWDKDPQTRLLINDAPDISPMKPAAFLSIHSPAGAAWSWISKMTARRT